MSTVTTSRNDDFGIVKVVGNLCCLDHKNSDANSAACVTPRQSAQPASLPVNTHDFCALQDGCTHTNNVEEYKLIHIGGSIPGSANISPQIIDLCPSVNAGGLLIGRCKDKATVVLSGGCGAQYVSRIHAEICIAPSGLWTLIDKESENGCFVNGYRVRKQELHVGDIVTIGGGGLSPFGMLEPHLDSEFVYRVIKGSTTQILPDDVAQKPSDRAVVPEKRRRSRCTTDHKSQGHRQATERKPPTLVDQNSQAPLQKRARKVAKTDASTLRRRDHVSSRRDTTRSVKMESICKELQCSICLGFLVSAHTLACGHSFCLKCINRALEVRRKCPMCMAQVRTAPVPSVALNNCVRRTLQPYIHGSVDASKSPQCNDLCESIHEWVERVRAQKKSRKREQQRLIHFRKVVRKAKEKDHQFLRVYRPWKARERTLFHRGLSLYRGVLRREYCNTIMLTKQVVDECSPTTLCIIANNIGVSVERTKIGSLRDRIKMFIDFS